MFFAFVFFKELEIYQSVFLIFRRLLELCSRQNSIVYIYINLKNLKNPRNPRAGSPCLGKPI